MNLAALNRHNARASCSCTVVWSILVAWVAPWLLFCHEGKKQDPLNLPNLDQTFNMTCFTRLHYHMQDMDWDAGPVPGPFW